MKYILEPVLIVEGKDDQAYLSSFLVADFILTNGYDFKKEDIVFLNRLVELRKVILLTDPDEAGLKIRDNINKVIPNLININVDIRMCDKNNKHGIRECNKEELIKVLSPYFVKESYKQDITASDICFIKNKTDIVNYYCLGNVNSTKGIIKRLNMLRIKKEELEVLYGN